MGCRYLLVSDKSCAMRSRNASLQGGDVPHSLALLPSIISARVPFYPSTVLPFCQLSETSVSFALTRDQSKKRDTCQHTNRYSSAVGKVQKSRVLSFFHSADVLKNSVRYNKEAIFSAPPPRRCFTRNTLQFNHQSTRGHCIMTLEVERPHPDMAGMKQKGRVYVCDLAGTEPAGDIVFAKYDKKVFPNGDIEHKFIGAHEDDRKTKELQVWPRVFCTSFFDVEAVCWAGYTWRGTLLRRKCIRKQLATLECGFEMSAVGCRYLLDAWLNNTGRQ